MVLPLTSLLLPGSAGVCNVLLPPVSAWAVAGHVHRSVEIAQILSTQPFELFSASTCHFSAPSDTGLFKGEEGEIWLGSPC